MATNTHLILSVTLQIQDTQAKLSPLLCPSFSHVERGAVVLGFILVLSGIIFVIMPHCSYKNGSKTCFYWEPFTPLPPPPQLEILINDSMPATYTSLLKFIYFFGTTKNTLYLKNILPRQNTSLADFLSSTPGEILQEYEVFKMCAFEINVEKSAKIKQEIRALKRNLSTILTVASNEKKIKELKQKIGDLEATIDKMPFSDMYKMLCEPGRAYQFPNILVLLEIAILCPVGNATVERLFSFLKIVKTRMRSSLGDHVLDSLLRIKMESKEELSDEDLEELVDMFKQYLMELSKSGEIRVAI